MDLMKRICTFKITQVRCPGPRGPSLPPSAGLTGTLVLWMNKTHQQRWPGTKRKVAPRDGGDHTPRTQPYSL